MGGSGPGLRQYLRIHPRQVNRTFRGPRMPEFEPEVDGMPNLSGSETALEEFLHASHAVPGFLAPGSVGFGDIKSAFAIALHMHQPLIPAGGSDLRSARIISNLQWMLEHPDIGDNHNARVFMRCYKRMGEFTPQLIDQGLQPRVMLEYSGTLLYGLRQMGANDVLDALRTITVDERYHSAVSGLGSPGAKRFLHPRPPRDIDFTFQPCSPTSPTLFDLAPRPAVLDFHRS